MSVAICLVFNLTFGISMLVFLILGEKSRPIMTTKTKNLKWTPSKLVKASKPSNQDKELEKGCQPLKDVENEKDPCIHNALKADKIFDEGHRL